MLKSALLRLIALTCALALVPAVQAGEASPWKLGVHYEQVEPPQPTQTGEKIEVLEIFWYGCPHCYQFEAFIEPWKAKLAEDVGFRRLPAVFGDRWLPAAKAYYTAEILGVTDTLHPAIFRAIHEQKRPFGDQGALGKIAADAGVDKKEFDKAWDSFENDARTRAAVKMSGAYGITGVPAVIVNGKYRTSARQAGGYEEMLQLVDHLVELERGARRTP